MWSLEWGSRVEMLQKISKQEGELTPSLQNRPLIRPLYQKYYDAFQLLNGSRQWTMGGPSAIPFSEISAYITMSAVTNAEEREEYIMFIQALDNAYLSYTHDKRKSTK